MLDERGAKWVITFPFHVSYDTFSFLPVNFSCVITRRRILFLRSLRFSSLADFVFELVTSYALCAIFERP